MASLGELFIELAFEGDTSKAEEFKKKLLDVSKAQDKNEMSVKKAKAAVLGYVAAITGAVFAIQKLTDSLIAQNQQWLNLTRTSDIALTTYQKWDSVGRMFGINNAAEQIKNLNDRLFELKLTGANAQGFMLAGINPTNAEDVMEQLRARVAGLSDTSASYLLKQMGLDPNMLHILRMTREEFSSLTKEMSKFQLTKEQRKSIQEMNFQIQIASQKLQYLKDRAILAILPFWTEFLKLITNTAVSISKFIGWIKNLNPTLTRTIKIVAGLAAGLVAVGAAINVIKAGVIALKAILTALKFDPIYLGLTLIIGAIALLADDIRAYMTGGGSLIGVFIKFLKDIQNEMDFNTPQWIKDLLRIIDNWQKIRNLKPDSAEATQARKEIGESTKNLGSDVVKAKIPMIPIVTPMLKTYGTAASIGGFLNQKFAERQLKQYNHNLSNNNQTNVVINADIQTSESMQTLENLYTPYLSNANRSVVYQST